MNKISDLHEQYTPKGEIEREGYVRQHFEVSGKGFEFTFSDKMVDLMEILGHCEVEPYATWQEASKAAQLLKIKGQREYRVRYKEDPKLPSAPWKAYSNFPGLREFLGVRVTPGFYQTWREASKASNSLGFTTAKEYRANYKRDVRLPSTPEQIYSDFPGWLMFLRGEQKREYYRSWQKARVALKKLGIRTQLDYNQNYHKDSRLPSNPQRHYKNFPSWPMFIRGEVDVEFYPSWQEASRAAIKLGVTTRKVYLKLYDRDPKLPSNPHRIYKDFPGFPMFCGRK